MILPPLAPLPFLSPNFGSHMVLQRDKPNVFWGWTTPGATVTVSVADEKASGRARPDGKWIVRFRPPKTGGPYRVLIDGPEHAELDDVLVGDVWLCTGQSNMEFGLTQANGGAEVAKADRPRMRLFMAPRQVGYEPKAVNGGTWKVCTPTTVAQDGWGGFSAVGYNFGKILQDELKVPIGLVEDCWGGTSAEAWTSVEGIRPLGDFDPVLANVDAVAKAGGPVFGTHKNLWLDAGDPGRREGWQAEGYDDSGWSEVALPSAKGMEGPPNTPKVVWYRRTVEVPQGGSATLLLNRIDETDTTWVNGELLGTTSFDWAWRRYPVTLKPGRNTLAVRVFTNGGRPTFLGKPEEMVLQLSDGSRVPLAGEWKTKPALESAALSSRPRDTEPNPTVPSTLYNGMIAPLAPMAIKGAIWYQGETNSGRGAQYRRLLPAMIADWRRAFGQGDFPFYIVSLANFMRRDPSPGDDNWAELRDAQAYAARALPNSGLAVTIDVGEADDVHPKDKRTVGARLAAVALARTYGRKTEYAGPTYRAMKVEGDAVRVSFDHAKGMWTGKPGVASIRMPDLVGFAVAGEDRKWRWATARIEGETVIVRSPDVPRPVAVRYAWGHNPEVNLANAAGFPAAPFRTDDWPLLSRDAK